MNSPIPFCAALDSLPVPVWRFDREDRITGWNRAAAAVYGLPAEHAVGQSALLFVPHEELSRFARACEETRATGQWAGDLPTLSATGQPRLADASWRHIPETDEIVATMPDTSEARQKQASAERAGRWAAVRSAVAAVAIAGRDGRAWARRFGKRVDPVAKIYCGAGEWVLVAAENSAVAELTRELLEAAGYRTMVASDRFDVVRKAESMPGQFRAATLGFGADTEEVAAALHRVCPMVPVVELAAPNPVSILRATAEAVAADVLTGVEILGERPESAGFHEIFSTGGAEMS